MANQRLKPLNKNLLVEVLAEKNTPSGLTIPDSVRSKSFARARVIAKDTEVDDLAPGDEVCLVSPVEGTEVDGGFRVVAFDRVLGVYRP